MTAAIAPLKNHCQKFTLRLLQQLAKPNAVTLMCHCAVVLTAYGFSAKRDLLAQPFALNQEVAAKIEKSEPVTAPGQRTHIRPNGKLKLELQLQVAAPRAIV